MSKFTPGPWSVGHSRKQMYGGMERWETPVHVGVGSLRGNALAIVYNGAGGAIHADRDSVEANARLIAAAPDLLDICKRQREELRLIRMKDCGAVYDTTVRIEADMVIAKAEA